MLCFLVHSCQWHLFRNLPLPSLLPYFLLSELGRLHVCLEAVYLVLGIYARYLTRRRDSHIVGSTSLWGTRHIYRVQDIQNRVFGFKLKSQLILLFSLFFLLFMSPTALFVLFMCPTILFQLIFIFIYRTFSKKISVSVK